MVNNCQGVLAGGIGAAETFVLFSTEPHFEAGTLAFYMLGS